MARQRRTSAVSSGAFSSCSRRFFAGDRRQAGEPGVLGVGRVLAEVGQLVPVQGHRGDGRRLEELGGRGRQRRTGPLLGHHLAQHAEQLHAQLVGRLEAVGRVGRAALGDQAVERVVVAEQRRRLRVGQRGEVRRLVALELHAQHDERAADRVDVGGDTRPGGGDLGRLVADRPVDRRLLVVDVADAAEVDQLEGVADLDEVVRLEVAVHEARGRGGTGTPAGSRGCRRAPGRPEAGRRRRRWPASAPSAPA